MEHASTHPFDQLTPDTLLDAMESLSVHIDGSVSALNSYENRVYQIGIEGDSPLIAKFYRPERWDIKQIQEEHDFCFALEAHDIPVVAPIKQGHDLSVFEHEGFLFALFKRKGGYAPELDHQDNLAIMARTLARLHRVGETHVFQHRPTLDTQNFGQDSINYVAEQFIPFEHKTSYLNTSNEIIKIISSQMAGAKNISVHGDLHVGNILMRDEIPNLVDFDDSRLAPAIQDIWMLLSGEPEEQEAQLQKIIPAYNEFREFPQTELKMIPALQTLRMIHHTAWLARRWDDPAFPPAFPWFDTHQFWQQHVSDLNNQLILLNKRASET